MSSISMSKFRIKQHLQGRKIIENFIEAKDKKEAELKYKNEIFLNHEWKEIEEEYRLIDTEIDILENNDTKKHGDNI
jgi:hypothetical protein